MKKVSIIIPAYNMEGRVGICIESTINQSYDNIEVIVIDDGSTDRTRAICEEYARQDPRIKVFSRANGGVAEATNMGLDKMTGDYVLFLDSDDYIEKEAVAVLVKEIEERNVDIVQCGTRIELENGDELGKEYYESQLICGRKKILEKHLVDKLIGGNLAQKLFKAVLFQDIRLPKGRNLADVTTMIWILQECNSYMIIPQVLYVAVKRTESVSQAPLNDKAYEDILYYIRELKNIYVEEYRDIFWEIGYAELKMWILCYNRVKASSQITQGGQRLKELTRNYKDRYSFWRSCDGVSNLPAGEKIKLELFRFSPLLYTIIVKFQSRNLNK